MKDQDVKDLIFWLRILAVSAAVFALTFCVLVWFLANSRLIPGFHLFY